MTKTFSSDQASNSSFDTNAIKVKKKNPLLVDVEGLEKSPFVSTGDIRIIAILLSRCSFIIIPFLVAFILNAVQFTKTLRRQFF